MAVKPSLKTSNLSHKGIPMQQVYTRLGLCGWVAGLAMLAASCGERGERLPETGASLEGTITYGDTRVPFAVVTAMGEKGMATGHVREDGRYQVANVPLGEVGIAVNTTAAKGEYVSKVMAQSRGKGKSPSKFIDVPAKYHDAETSGLKTEIKRGVNTYDIVIPK
jgi:hypothetical protein